MLYVLKVYSALLLLLNLDVSDIFADLIKADLHPITTVFIPLASSPNHYFVAKAVQNGIVFELLKVAKVPNENGLGMRYMVGDRTMMDLGKLRARRKGGDDKPQRSA